MEKLTQFSKSSGCGCKIAPSVLNEILEKSGTWQGKVDALLVGNDSMDDASVYDLGNGTALISTVDFFTPIVDDPFDFGRIAAANALSDVFAMGGRPVFANALLSWPVDVLGTTMAAEVLRGAKSVCETAGVVISGGHSIAGTEPLFGLAVNGFAPVAHIKRNNTARKGDLVYLTKQVGIGILATAIKRGIISDMDYAAMLEVAVKLNTSGAELSSFSWVHSITDVTGFGLLGHLLEMASGSGLTMELELEKVPRISGIDNYISQYVFPDNVYKNWNAYESRTGGVNGMEMVALCDPQTSGGLLISVDPHHAAEIEEIFRNRGEKIWQIGRFVHPGEKVVQVLQSGNGV